MTQKIWASGSFTHLQKYLQQAYKSSFMRIQRKFFLKIVENLHIDPSQIINTLTVFEQLVRANNKGNHQRSTLLALCEVNHQWLGIPFIKGQ